MLSLLPDSTLSVLLLQVAGCGYGVTCHVRTFLHGCSRITLSIATLPSTEALPGEERGQVGVGVQGGRGFEGPY